MISRTQHGRCPLSSRRHPNVATIPIVLNPISRGQCVTRAGEGIFGKLFGGGKPADSSGGSGAAAAPAQQQEAPEQRGTEFPPFQTVSKNDGYDLRFYEPYPVVEMDYRRRENGYLTLGQYMDGANADRTTFSFTQPVVMTYYPEGRKTMAMMVGSQRRGGGGAAAAAALPAPTDGSVRLGVAGGELVAVLRFAGYITPQTAEAARKQLLAALKRDGLKLAEAEEGGLFRVAQYGQVYTLEERLNEMILKVQL